MPKAIRTEAGSISHGTLRNKDLLHAFSSELDSLHGNRGLIARAEAVLLLLDAGWSFQAEDECISELVCDLQDELNEHCSEDLYFGSHEGDGSDYGFWPIDQGNV